MINKAEKCADAPTNETMNQNEPSAFADLASMLGGLDLSSESGSESEEASSGEENEEEHSTITVTCPDGAVPGDTISVQTADGSEVDVVVPGDVSPGEEFDITIAGEEDDEGVGSQEDEEDQKDDDANRTETTSSDGDDGEQSVTIVCPDDAGAGDSLVLEIDGSEIEITIPEGVEAGEEFEIQVS